MLRPSSGKRSAPSKLQYQPISFESQRASVAFSTYQPSPSGSSQPLSFRTSRASVMPGS